MGVGQRAPRSGDVAAVEVGARSIDEVSRAVFGAGSRGQSSARPAPSCPADRGD
ncbi:hypothetical protein O7634_26260 [Micromonospora sp. WMMD1120]|uniref:hypothetical protein n=1 Tax=Micromonospora sp. WMMD1120 TaxID=3016106 RepID=UPI0024165920|nr:hypothetical protein [Micromonospora sp. WMMD1120]MDG4810272.1 hypothetical protein [Micromonospora sp. WMMD1120]